MALEQLAVPGPFIASSVIDYLSSSEPIYNRALYKTDVDGDLESRYTFEDLGVRFLLSQMGMEKGVDSSTLQHFEEDRMTATIHVQAGYATGSESTTLSITTSSPNDRFEYPGSGNSIYPVATAKYGIGVVKGQKLEARVGTTIYYMYVTAISLVSTPTITVQLTDVTSTNAATTFAAGLADVAIFVTGSMLGETTSPEGTLEARLISYTNTMQTTMREYSFSTKQMGQATSLDGKNKYNYFRGIMNSRKKFNGDCDRDFLTSRTITSSAAVFDQTAAFEGLYPYLLNYANESTYSTWTLQNFGDMGVELMNNGAPDKMVGLMSPTVMNDVETAIGGYTQLVNGGIVYDVNHMKDNNVDFGFKNFSKAGITFNLKAFKALGDKECLGNMYSQYAEYLALLPSGNVDGYDIEKMPTNSHAFASVYLNVPQHNLGFREYPIWGSGGPNPVNKSPLNLAVMSQFQTFEAWLPNAFAIFIKE